MYVLLEDCLASPPLFSEDEERIMMDDIEELLTAPFPVATTEITQHGGNDVDFWSDAQRWDDEMRNWEKCGGDNHHQTPPSSYDYDDEEVLIVFDSRYDDTDVSTTAAAARRHHRSTNEEAAMTTRRVLRRLEKREKRDRLFGRVSTFSRLHTSSLLLRI